MSRSTAGRRRRSLVGRVALALVAVVALAGCGSSDPGIGNGQPSGGGGVAVVRAPGAMAKPASNLGLRGFGDGMTSLGYQLARQLSDDAKDGNLVYSPASLAIAFAMVREGAAGDSAAQIDRAMHLPADRRQAFNALVTALQTPGPGNTLSVGDAIFTAKGYPIKQKFLAALQKWYGAGVYQTTFPDAGKAAVNAYVDKQTHGLIPRLITDQFDIYTVMSLINTLYLDAKWQRPFDQNLTSKMPFTTTAGERVGVHMMWMPEQPKVDYASGDSWQAVRLPYQGNRLSMIVLVPNASTDPTALLDPKIVSAAARGFAPATVDLQLPRWTFGTDADLAELTRALGMNAPFEPGGFPGITADPRFRLDSVIQQARIQVGEKGTVAAAATQIEGVAEAGVLDLRTVHADHPFAYLIVDNTTGVPVFEGTVGDPTSH